MRADQSLEQVAAIVASSEDAIYSATPDGIITSWNQGAEKLYGYRSDEVLGKPVLITVPPERVHESRSHFDRLTKGEPVESYQTERRRKDGSLVSVMLSVSPLRDRKGIVIGDHAHICPGVVLCGGVTVGEGAVIGANATVKDGIRIGAWATVGCGAVVVRDVPPGLTVVGKAFFW